MDCTDKGKPAARLGRKARILKLFIENVRLPKAIGVSGEIYPYRLHYPTPEMEAALCP